MFRVRRIVSVSIGLLLFAVAGQAQAGVQVAIDASIPLTLLHGDEASEDVRSRMSGQWRDDGGPALAALADARRTLLDRREFLDLRASVLAEEAGVQAPNFVFPHRAGDLDGDGKHDVLTFEQVWGAGSTLTARSGTDGRALWSMPDVGIALPVDLDGDGVSEVLVLTDEWTPVAEGIQLLTERISLVSGVDGTPLWSVELNGSSSRNWDEHGLRGHDLQFVSSLRVMPDATGDGRPDVWVGTTNGVFVDRLEQDGIYIVADAFVGRTLDGTTGVEVGRVAAAGVDDAFPWAIPVSDVSGDGLADVFVLSGRSWDTGVLSAQSVLGTPWWIQPVRSGQAFLSSADVDGDGAPDAMLLAFHDGGPSLIGHSGASGEELWVLPYEGYIDVAGDIDGDGGQDLIQLRTYGGGTEVFAFSGANGAPIWGPVDYAAPNAAWVELCICTGDVNGDGVWDPLLAEIVFGADVEVTVRMLDGTDGNQLWSRVLGPGEGLPIPIGADADGDGIEDVGLMTPDGIDVLRGFDLAALWTAPGEAGKSVLGFYGDDLVGDGKAEIVAARIEFVEEDVRGSAAGYSPDGRMWAVP